MTPQELANAARCFECIPPGMRQAVIISLLDQIAAGGGGGGGSQTPWLSDIDGGGFSLSNVNSITATSFTGALTGAASANVLKAGDTMTGVLRLTGGSAAVPALNWGDVDTGIYAPAPGQLGMSFNGDNLFNLNAAQIRMASGIAFGWCSSATDAASAAEDIRMTRTGAGILTLDDGSGSFERLNIGPATAGFPAIKASTTTLQVRLANDSAFTNIQGKLTTDVNAVTGLGAGVVAALTNATLTLTDASGQVYRVPAII